MPSPHVTGKRLIAAFALLLLAAAGAARLRSAPIPLTATATAAPSVTATALLQALALATHTPAPSPTPLATSSHTETPTVTQIPTRIIIPTATPTAIPTATPFPTATAPPAPKATGRPELYEVVDRAFETLKIEPLPPVRNSENTAWLFPFHLSWTPPDLKGVPGAERHLPFDIPYYFRVEIQIKPYPAMPDRSTVHLVAFNDYAKVLDGMLPKDVYCWQFIAYYHSMSYDKTSDWTPCQIMEVK